MHFILTMAVYGFMAACGSDPAPTPPPVEPEMAKEEPAKDAPEAVEAAPEKEESGPDFAAMGADETKAFLMTLGEEVYKTGGSGGVACSTCHQLNGKGLPPSFPPLAGAQDWMKDCQTHAGYVINGLKGEIEVLGVKYNGVMPSQGNLSDLEIAAVITYERMSWGNDYGLCMPETVAAAR